MARDRIRLAFDDPELERHFLADVIREAPSRARVGLAIGVPVFLASAGTWAAVVVPGQLGITLSLMYGVGGPVCVLGIGLTWLPGYGRWVWPRSALMIAMGASFIAVQAFHPSTPHWFSFGILSSLVLYVYLVARIRITGMIAVTLTLSAAYLLVIARQLEPRLTAHYGLFLTMMNGFGIWASYSAERYRRREWLQSREIKRQKETITLERARSEALLRTELSHQVAERSRELGDALVRAGTPISLRLPVPGDRFHTRYRVLRALGEGGMAGGLRGRAHHRLPALRPQARHGRSVGSERGALRA